MQDIDHQSPYALVSVSNGSKERFSGCSLAAGSPGTSGKCMLGLRGRVPIQGCIAGTVGIIPVLRSPGVPGSPFLVVFGFWAHPAHAVSCFVHLCRCTSLRSACIVPRCLISLLTTPRSFEQKFFPDVEMDPGLSSNE